MQSMKAPVFQQGDFYLFLPGLDEQLATVYQGSSLNALNVQLNEHAVVPKMSRKVQHQRIPFPVLLMSEKSQNIRRRMFPMRKFWKKKKKVKTYENDQYVMEIMKILNAEAKNCCCFPLGIFQPPFQTYRIFPGDIKQILKTLRFACTWLTT